MMPRGSAQTKSRLMGWPGCDESWFIVDMVVGDRRICRWGIEQFLDHRTHPREMKPTHAIVRLLQTRECCGQTEHLLTLSLHWRAT